MRIVRSLAEIDRDRNSVVTVGTFDGVHLAHREILREVGNRSRMREGRSVVLTFDPHPAEVVARPRGPVRILSTVQERITLLQAMNIDVLFLVDFTYDFSRLTSGEFARRYIIQGVGVSEIVVGYDHMFGRNREAGIEELVRMGHQFDFSVFAVHPYTVDGEIVSSTHIRKDLARGDITRANAFLGYPYSVSGRIVRGDGRGKRVFGYPTANIEPDSHKKVIPARGVYLVGVECTGRRYFGMMNIGVRPTVTTDLAETLEVHIFDFDTEIYGEPITVSFLKRLREERKFAGIQELVDQLAKDKEQSLADLANFVKNGSNETSH